MWISLKKVQVLWTCKRFHIGTAIGMLVVLLPLFSAVDDGEAVARQHQGRWRLTMAVAAVAVAVGAFDDGAAFDSARRRRRR